MEQYYDMDRMQKQIDFILEVDKEKRIGRQTYLTGTPRKENDAEHSWHLALMALLMQEYVNEPVDITRVVFMVLIHDLVEIDAGDTYAYDAAGNETKRARELAAAERIFNILPEDQAAYVRGLWDEFEESKTPEAKYANTLDKIQPLLLNDATGGIAWKEHDVAASQVFSRNARTHEGSEALWAYGKTLIERNKGKALRDA